MSANAAAVLGALPAQTILVVEDEVLVRISIAAYLRECGYKVIEAVNAAEARQVLKQPDVPVDLVFSGLQMSGSNAAFGLAQWVRKNRPGLKMIMVASLDRAAEAAGELCETGPQLSKPYEPQTVIDHIRRLLGERGRNA